MKVSRKIQDQFEAKMKHAIATGPLPFIDRSSSSGTQAKEEMDKTNGNESGQSK